MTSVWLQDAIATEIVLPADVLDGDLRVDVAIVGGGYTGLWTAIELKSREPGLDVAVIERDVCGAGASGANAGFALSIWMAVAALAKRGGEEEAVRLCRASDAAINEIESLASAHGIDAQVDRRGVFWGATCPMQSGHWDRMLETVARYQIRHYRVMDGEEIRAGTGAANYVAGVLDTSSALIHPGHLVRGLRRLAIEKGVRIFEHTAMTELKRGRPPAVVTPRGTVTADKVVLGIYGWSLQVPELRPAIMVICTDAVMTQPMPERIAASGWRDYPGLTDSRIFVEAQRTTADGRVMWTKAGGRLPFGARLDAALVTPHKSVAQMRALLREVYPDLADAPIAGTWSGPIDRSRTGLPLFGRLPTCPDILYGYGYSGAGIVLSRLGSKILASLALDTDDAWSSGPLVRAPDRAYPPEPIRWVGGHMVHAAIARKDRLDHEGRKTGPVTDLLLKFKPPSYKPT
jgi:glycine/D-amino acid oxidase-like deaminating enzyme